MVVGFTTTYTISVMVFNATFNNISVVSRRSVFLVEETGGRGENHRPVEVTDKLYYIILYRAQLARAVFELTTLVVIDNDCIGSQCLLPQRLVALK
jgi:hypothetical protein